MKNLGFLSFIILQLSIFNINSDVWNNSKIYYDSSSENYLFKESFKNSFIYGDINSLFNSFQNKEGDDKKNETKYAFYRIFKNELEYIFEKNEMKNISFNCKKILEENLLGKINETHYNEEIYFYNIKKLLDDSSKHKNDLGTFEQCINRKYYVDADILKNYKSIYVIFILDESGTINTTTQELLHCKNTTDIEDIFYVRAFCLPQEKQNDTCSDKEYLELMLIINKELSNMLGIKNDTKVFSLKKYENDKMATFISSIPFILGFIQCILIAFREVIMKCFKQYYKSKNKGNIKGQQLVDELPPNSSINKHENDEREDNEDKDEDNYKEIKKNEITNLPNWLKIYNNCFNFTENFRELFNFSLNSTSINNDSGLFYIRGLKSSCLFLLILGLTYLTLMNSLSKILSKTLFLSFLKDYKFYGFFLIGLRYAPRVIFSCSGYTLAYKYLCYINKDFTFLSVFKFIFYQIHKYFFLIIFFTIQRYSLYHFYNYMTSSDSPMWKYLYKNILSRPEGARFVFSFLSLSSLFAVDKGSRYDQTLIDYFWLPYNEVFFFMVGLIIITIGYKCKLRIDIFILILIVLLFATKITYSYLQRSTGNEMYYATLYYYLFDYGKFMINPLFNLPSYLIGMYFGLINYTVQKGIITLGIPELNKDNSLNEVLKNEELDLKKFVSDDKKNEDEEDEDECDISLKDSLINNNQIYNENNKNNYRLEIKQIPFLTSGVKISNWLRNSKARIIRVLMFICMIFFVAIHFIVLQITIGSDYDDIIKKYYSEIGNDTIVDNEEIKERILKMQNILSLEDYISNTFINVMFRIDIEIFVFFTQSLLFIFYFKGQNFINDFYCHVFWAMLNKSYFSYILIANPLLLFVFYQSETKIIVNLFNLVLYSLISGCFIFIIASFTYIFFELPYKRLIHYICSGENIEDYKKKDDDEEEEKEDSDEEE